MALTPDEATRLRDMLKEIEELSIKLKTNINTTNLQDVEKNAKEIENLFDILNNRWKDLTKDVDIAVEGFRDLAQEITKQNLGLKESTKAYNNLISIGQKIQNYQREGTGLTLKELEKYKERVKLEKLSLENANKLLSERQTNLTKEKNQQKSIADNYQKAIDALLVQDKLSKVQSDRLTLLEKLQEKQNQKVEGLNDKLKQTKDLLTANQAVIDGNDESFNNLSASIEETARQIKEKLIDGLDTGFKNIVKEIQTTDDGIKQINKSYNTLSSIAQQIQDHQAGSSKMTEHEAGLLLDKLESERKRLANNRELLKTEHASLEIKKEAARLEQESIASKIQYLENEAKIRTLRTEEVNDLQTLKQQQSSLFETQKDIISELNLNEKAQEKILSIINKQDEGYNELVKKTKEIQQQQENLRKAMGLSGAAVDGIGNAFKKIGLGSLADQMGLDKAKARMKEVAERITDGGKKSAGLVGQFKILRSGIASLGGSIMKNLTDPLVLAGLAAKAVSAGVGLIKKGVGLLSKGFGSVVGFVKNLWGMADQFASVFEKYAKAGQFAAQNFSAAGGQINKVISGLNAAAAADPFMRVAEAGPALKSIVDSTGIMQSQMTKSVKEAHELSYWLGYSAEETGKLYNLTQLNTKSGEVSKDAMKDMLAEIRSKGALLNKEYKTSVDLRKVEQTALKASASITYNLKQNPKALADAAFHATKLGMTLDEINSAASATLDFESSISGQLAYQAISGKELNIDAYQQAKLNKDAVGMSRELNNLVKLHQKELEGSVFAQEEFARVTGMTVAQQDEAMQLMQLQNDMGEDQKDIEVGIQRLMKEKNISRAEAAKQLTKQDISDALAASKRAEAMSRSLEDFRDYMATRLWPLFKAVFSPANIKMFMAVINGMRPVFAELGKAITALFPAKSAELVGKTLKEDIMPTILLLAKSVTNISGIFGGTLFNILKEKIAPLIEEKIIPLTEKIAKLFEEFAPEIGSAVESVSGDIVDTISDAIDLIMNNKDEIKEFLKDFYNKVKSILSFVKDNAKEITATVGVLAGINLLKTTGVLDVANTMLKAVGQVTGITPGGKRNPFYVWVMGGGGMMPGPSGPGMDTPGGNRRPSTPETNYQKYSRKAGNVAAGLGVAFGLYTMAQSFMGKGEKDVTQEEIDTYRSQTPSKHSEEISTLEAKGAERTKEDDERLADLIAKSNKEAIDEIVSSQYQTGSKTGDIALGLTETVGSSLAYQGAPQMSTDEVLKKIAEMKAADPTKTTAQALDDIRQAEKSFLTKIGDKASELWGNAKTWLSETVTSISTKTSELLGSAKTWLSETATKIGEKSKQLLDDVGKGITKLAAKAEELASRAAGFISDMVGAAKDKILNLASSAKDMVTNAVNAVKESNVGKTVSTTIDKGMDLGKKAMNWVSSKASSAYKTAKNVISNPKAAASSALSGVKDVASNIASSVKNSSVGKTVASAGSAISEGAGKVWKWTKDKVLDPFKNAFKGIGKFLGPIMTAISSITSVMGTIQEAKYNMSMGQPVDHGELGKKIIQNGAYPIANAALNFIPGIGTAISLADAGLDMLGVSPVRFISDNLINLIPKDVFAGLGKYALGDAQPAQQVQDGGLNPNGGPVVSTFQKGELVPVMQGIKEDNVYMTTNKPAQVQDGYYGQSTPQDNSAVITAINKLSEAIMSNSSKEVILKIGKEELARVMTGPILTETKNTAISF